MGIGSAQIQHMCLSSDCRLGVIVAFCLAASQQLSVVRPGLACLTCTCSLQRSLAILRPFAAFSRGRDAAQGFHAVPLWGDRIGMIVFNRTVWRLQRVPE